MPSACDGALEVFGCDEKWGAPNCFPHRDRHVILIGAIPVQSDCPSYTRLVRVGIAFIQLIFNELLFSTG